MQSNTDKNLEFIEKYILPNLGLSDVPGLPEHIKAKLDEGLSQWSFAINDKVRGKDVNAEYIFSKSETNSDDPNSYLSAVKGRVIGNDGTIEHEQEFRVVNQRFVPMEKMLGLMTNNNAVSFDYFKDGDRIPRHGYLQINAEGELKLYANATTNFNLARALSEIPLHKMTALQKEKMIYDINNGFPPTVEVKMPDGSIQKAKLEIHPKIGAVIAKDLDGNRLLFKEGMKIISDAPKLNIVKDGTKKDENELSAKAKELLKKAEEKKNKGQKNDPKKNSKRQTG